MLEMYATMKVAIVAGERPPMGAMDCMRSLFYLHNQWANIWIFILKIPMSATACFILSSRVIANGDGYTHIIPFAVLLFACLAHTPVSIAYHLFMPVSPSLKLALNRADYACIFVMIMLITYALGFYPFFCQPQLQRAQLFLTGVPAAMNVAMSLTPVYRRASQTRAIRAVSSGIVICLALTPVFYSAAHDGITGPAALGLAACASYVIGGLVWVFHFPECMFPGVFDRHLNSHACMHACIVVSHMLFYGFISHQTVGGPCVRMTTPHE